MNRIVFITGSSGGLGRSLARQFLLENWTVIATSRSVVDLPPHDRLDVRTLDVQNEQLIHDLVADVVSKYGRIDCLINNAGIVEDAAVWQIADDSWDRVIDINLTAAFRCARAVARQMAKQRDGSIINIGSHAGRAGARGQSNYSAAKAGLLGLSQSLARELGSRNVRVNAVLPGVLPTMMTASLDPAQLDDFARANALGRINSLDEVARFITFLAGTQNISGQVFQLDSRIVPWT